MYNQNELSVDFAVSQLARGKRGTGAIIRMPNGNLQFVGMGYDYLPVLKLGMCWGEKFFDETSYNFNLIFRKCAGLRESWHMLAAQNWELLEASTHPNATLRFVAVVKPPKDEDIAPEFENVPLVVSLRSDTVCHAVAIARDADINKLFLAEMEDLAKNFVKKEVSNNERAGNLEHSFHYEA